MGFTSTGVNAENKNCSVLTADFIFRSRNHARAAMIGLM
jgi:hypothetical protein